MLLKPKYGWSRLEIGNWSDRISYLDDAAFMLLETIIKSYEEPNIQSVEFDAEGYEWKLVFDGEKVTVITEKDETEITNLDVSRTDIAKGIIDDIRHDVRDWVNFVYWDLDEAAQKEREDELLTLCKQLEKLI